MEERVLLYFRGIILKVTKNSSIQFDCTYFETKKLKYKVSLREVKHLLL